MISPQKSRSNATLWIGLLVVVLVLAFLAILASRGDDDNGSGTGSGSKSATEVDTTLVVPAGVITDGEALPKYDATVDDPAVGSTIPTVTGKDFDGNDMTIGPDGKAKVIIFAAHWCPHCQRELPKIQDHLDDNPMPDDVELLTVSTNEQPGADNYPPEEWLKSFDWAAPVLDDGSESGVAAAYGLSSFPYFVVVDADGKVVERKSGELSMDEFDALVKAAQSGGS